MAIPAEISSSQKNYTELNVNILAASLHIPSFRSNIISFEITW